MIVVSQKKDLFGNLTDNRIKWAESGEQSFHVKVYSLTNDSGHQLIDFIRLVAIEFYKSSA